MVSAKIWGRFWCMQYRLWQPCRFETTQCNSLVNSSNWVLQVQVVDQTTHPPKCHSFVGLDRQIGSSPPANVKRFPANVKRFESKKFYICSDVTHTHRCLYTEQLWHTDAFTQRSRYTYTEQLLHSAAFTQRRLCAKKLFYTNAFTHRGLYTQKLLRTEVFTRKLYTEKLLHREASKQSIFNTQKHLYTHTSFTHTPLHTELLHIDAFTHRSLFTEQGYTEHRERPLHRAAFTILYVQKL